MDECIKQRSSTGGGLFPLLEGQKCLSGDNTWIGILDKGCIQLNERLPILQTPAIAKNRDH